MAEYTIQGADLRTIENNLSTIYRNIEVLNSNIDTVDGNVRVVFDKVDTLRNEFHEYVENAERRQNVTDAEVRLTNVRQELESKYGYYGEIRRSTVGILQADDLGIVREDTIRNAAEEMMLKAPDYWLAPCLVALAAWINDQPEIAARALKEGIRRNDEKTSLLFALVCRRAERKASSLKWVQRYLENQDEEDLDRKCIIIIDAYASGLFGSDAEGIIAKQMGIWLTRLSEKPGFVEQQIGQWSEAFMLKRQKLSDTGYIYLKKYSHTWAILQEVMEGAYLHGILYDYFKNIFEQQSSAESLKQQLDDILMKLVTNYDDEELPLREKEKWNELIIECGGDLQRAQTNMDIEKSTLETHKDFTQLLTDAAMKPEGSHASVSTQKFALALTKEWVVTAYNDVVAQNRMKVPNVIEINIDNFNATTTDGQNEVELVNGFNSMIDREKEDHLRTIILSGFEKFCLWGGAATGGIGIIMAIVSLIEKMIEAGSGSGSVGGLLFGIVIMIAGIGMLCAHFSKKKQVTIEREVVSNQYEEKRKTGIQILRATIAEIVDFRNEFQMHDNESEKVIDFLEQITPEQYIKTMADSTRKIKIDDSVK